MRRLVRLSTAAQNSGRLGKLLLGIGVCASFAFVVGGSESPAARADDGIDGKDSIVRAPTGGELESLTNAQWVLTSRCMQRRGFQYIVEPTDGNGPSIRNFPYFIDDVDWARQHGFGGDQQNGPQAGQGDDLNAKYFQSLSSERQQEARAALVGARPEGLRATTPTGLTVTANDHSCIAEAQRSLYGDLSRWFQASTVVKNLRPLVRRLVVQDRQFAEATVGWSKCMADSGYQVQDPDQLRRSLPELMVGLNSEQAREYEIRAATGEATCANSTSLAAVTKKLDRHYDELVRQRYRADIQVVYAMQMRALERARRIVASR